MSEQSPVNAVELNADQALGMVSFGLMQRLAKDGQVELPWLETAVDSEVERARQLRLSFLRQPLHQAEAHHAQGLVGIQFDGIHGGLLAHHRGPQC